MLLKRNSSFQFAVHLICTEFSERERVPLEGNNPRGNIHRAVSKIFTNKYAMNSLFITEAEFDNTVTEWLRFAKQRKQRKERET
ncbi:hypothetical protein ACFW04_013482 [Cataglyphis niger]